MTGMPLIEGHCTSVRATHRARRGATNDPASARRVADHGCRPFSNKFNALYP
jgi:hypothetical protein